MLIDLFMAVLGLCCNLGFSLVAESVGYSLVAALGLLIAVNSLVVEHQLWGLQFRLQCMGTAQVQQLSCTGLVAPQHVGTSQIRGQTP